MTRVPAESPTEDPETVSKPLLFRCRPWVLGVAFVASLVLMLICHEFPVWRTVGEFLAPGDESFQAANYRTIPQIVFLIFLEFVNWVCRWLFVPIGVVGILRLPPSPWTVRRELLKPKEDS